MNKELLTAGQFAKLASTTKRTVVWYDKEGILKPFETNNLSYRFYKPEQIIDFQVILLLRQLNFSIDQIKKFITKNKTLKDLFHEKRKIVLKEIINLKKQLKTIDNYYHNFKNEGLLIKPVVKIVRPAEIYYLQKIGPYSKIYRYGMELRSYFKKIPSNAEFLAVFEEPEYKPVRSKFKVGIIIKKGMEIKNEAKDIVFRYKLPKYKTLSYTYCGIPRLLSFHWKQLEKYAALHKLKQNKNLPFTNIEIYKRNGFVRAIDEDQIITEMHLPIT